MRTSVLTTILPRFATACAVAACVACSPNPQDVIRPMDAMLTPQEAAREMADVGELSMAPGKQLCESALHGAKQFEEAFGGAVSFGEGGGEMTASAEAWAQIPQRYRDNLLAIVALVGRCKDKSAQVGEVVVRDQLTGRIIYRGKPNLDFSL